MHEEAGEQNAPGVKQPSLSLLVRATALLQEGKEPEAALEQVLRLALPRLGGWCVAEIGSPGRSPRVLVVHRDPKVERIARELCRRYPDATSELFGVRRVLETGSTEAAAVDPAAVADAEHGRRLAALGTGGYTTVALKSRTRVLGTITFVSPGEAGTGAERTLAEGWDRTEERALAEGLATLVAFAIDNARLARRAREANRAKADFLAVISHELRTPLTAILGYSDLLSLEVKGPINPDQRKQLRRIEQSARHMVQLVEELISYARVESGTELLEPRDVDIETVLETALEAVRVEADQKGVALRTVIRTDAPFCTDPRMLRQIVLNLVSNGVKYTREGHVTVRASRRGDTLTLEVEDTGVGIDEATRERIFDPFWQAEAPNLRTYGGLGIGLSLTRRLVETLGGELELESAYGRGATFTVRLPSLRS